MKNITFVIADLGMGGAQRVISLIADHLSMSEGYHVNIVVLAEPGEKSFFSFPSHVDVNYVGVLGKSDNIFAALTANIRRILAIRRVFHKLQSDLVITFQTETNCSVLLSALGTGIPVIISERSDPYIHPQSRVWRWARRLLYPLASGGVFQTSYAADFFGRWTRRKTVIFNPVNVDKTDSEINVSGDYILGVGRLSEEKGFDELIKAHALARKRVAGLKLVIIGSGPDHDKIVSLARDLGTADDVIFAGALRHIGPYYKNALAFILPSRFEGLPNALIEAMAYGCPVIVTPAYKAAEEIVDHGHNGLISKAATAEAYSDQIIDLYEDNSLRKKLGEQGHVDSIRFSGEKIATEWKDFISLFL